MSVVSNAVSKMKYVSIMMLKEVCSSFVSFWAAISLLCMQFVKHDLSSLSTHHPTFGGTDPSLLQMQPKVGPGLNLTSTDIGIGIGIGRYISVKNVNKQLSFLRLFVYILEKMTAVSLHFWKFWRINPPYLWNSWKTEERNVGTDIGSRYIGKLPIYRSNTMYCLLLIVLLYVLFA